MTIYYNPKTFCHLVCELLAERGWKIRMIKHWDSVTLVLPDGTSAHADDGASALTSLCLGIATKHKLPIRYEEPPVDVKARRTPPGPTFYRSSVTSHFYTEDDFFQSEAWRGFSKKHF
jgi:hypothetical protein